MIYLDHAATTPMSKNAMDAYQRAATAFFGNPSSLHDIGSNASSLLELCREKLAKLIHGKSKGIFFTSGGSESNILALQTLIMTTEKKGKHIISTGLEHSSILNYLRLLEKSGYKITYLSVNQYGKIDLQELQDAITPNTVLATIQHANSEIGTIQDISKIGFLLKENGVLFHSDCVQSFGKIKIDVEGMNIDSLSISSHKVNGPKGVGACYINPSINWVPIIPNTTHEFGFRPGTVNVPGIAAFLAALEETVSSSLAIDQEQKRMKQLREVFTKHLNSTNNKWSYTIEGPSVGNMDHIVGLRVHGVEGQYLMLELNRYNIAVSTGSACSVGKQSPSQTMIAIGRSNREAKELIRFSFGKNTTENEVIQTVKTLKNILNQFFSMHLQGRKKL